MLIVVAHRTDAHRWVGKDYLENEIFGAALLWDCFNRNNDRSEAFAYFGLDATPRIMERAARFAKTHKGLSTPILFDIKIDLDVPNSVRRERPQQFPSRRRSRNPPSPPLPNHAGGNGWCRVSLVRGATRNRRHWLTRSGLHDDERLRGAINHFSEASRLNPQNGEAFRLRGAAWRMKGEFDKAIEDYTEAIRLNSNYGEAFLFRAGVWLTQEDFDKTVADASEAIRLDPTNADAFRARGSARGRMGHHDNAIADLSEAIRLKPVNAAAFICRGLSWQQTGELDKAISDFDAAIRLDPNIAAIYEFRAVHGRTRVTMRRS